MSNRPDDRPRASSFDPLEPALYRDLVRRALDEDVGAGDVTTAPIVDPGLRARGVFLVKEPCVLAGLDVSFDVFRQLEPAAECTRHREDGEACQPGDEVAEVVASARTLLVGERTALNFLQRMSGVASRARRFVEATGGRIAVLDTRKTTPTLRALEKYAVRAGGARNHRFGLFDAVLIKDNHIALAGSVPEAIRRVRAQTGQLPVEVEAQTLEQVDQAVAAGADIVLLDNMAPATIREAVARIGGRARVEISGGVTLERIPELATTGADYVSVGALTHSAPAVDISFDIEPL